MQLLRQLQTYCMCRTGFGNSSVRGLNRLVTLTRLKILTRGLFFFRMSSSFEGQPIGCWLQKLFKSTNCTISSFLTFIEVWMKFRNRLELMLMTKPPCYNCVSSVTFLWNPIWLWKKIQIRDTVHDYQDQILDFRLTIDMVHCKPFILADPQKIQ